MISIKLFFNRGVYQRFFLTLIFDHMERLGQIKCSQIPCKILTLGTEIKKLVSGPFESTYYQSRICKNMKAECFLEGISRLSIMV